MQQMHSSFSMAPRALWMCHRDFKLTMVHNWPADAGSTLPGCPETTDPGGRWNSLFCPFSLMEDAKEPPELSLKDFSFSEASHYTETSLGVLTSHLDLTLFSLLFVALDFLRSRMDIYFDAVITDSWLHPIPYQFRLALLLTNTTVSLVPFSPYWAKLSRLFSFPSVSPPFANLPILMSSPLVVQSTMKGSLTKKS